MYIHEMFFENKRKKDLAAGSLTSNLINFNKKVQNSKCSNIGGVLKRP